MKKFLFFLGSLLLLSFSHPHDTGAIDSDTFQQTNNKIGIHLAIATEEELTDAANLVNSSGGDWGYVTVVVQENDRDRGKWQAIFDKMRKLHLIPIVRLATSVEQGGWRKPNPDDAIEWVQFLDSLNWVIKNRYIVLFNEPNHAQEWGNRVDSQDFTRVCLEFAKQLKAKNPDFFVMLGGFDAAAPHKPPLYEDEQSFISQMFQSSPNEAGELFGYLDGWASHSYPNYGFIGSPLARGKVSVRTYLWEINFLKKMGLTRKLPVFITETGWPHSEGFKYNPSFLTETKVADNFTIYFQQLLKDPQVVAITPFVLNYQGELFDHFSWRKPGNTREFYTQHEVLKQLTKKQGNPNQEQRLIITSSLPEKLIQGSTYQIPITVRNEGQAIWNAEDGYKLSLLNSQDLEYFTSNLPQIAPFEEKTIRLYLKTNKPLRPQETAIVITKNGVPVSQNYNWSFQIFPTVDLTFTVNMYPKLQASGDDFRLLIYNEKDEVVFEKGEIKVEGGKGQVNEINNLSLGEKYRVVLLKPYYLPRQKILTIQEERNQADFSILLPLDFNVDGQLSLKDLGEAYLHPNFQRLYLPF